MCMFQGWALLTPTLQPETTRPGRVLGHPQVGSAPQTSARGFCAELTRLFPAAAAAAGLVGYYISLARDTSKTGVRLNTMMDVKTHTIDSAYPRGDYKRINLIYNGVNPSDAGDEFGPVSTAPHSLASTISVLTPLGCVI